MISMSFKELWKINPYKARQELIKMYQKLGGIKTTAKVLGCSRNTVKKWVRRYAVNQKLEELSRRPQRVPRKTSPSLEQSVLDIRNKTNLGRKRIATELSFRLRKKLSTHTIRHILERHGLSRPIRIRGRFKGIRFVRRQHIEPLTYWQTDVKDVRDADTLPKEVYEHLIDRGLPRYQWTAIDVRTRTKFLCYSHRLSFTLGLKFWLVLTSWLRSHGLSHKLYYQTDWGNEFGGPHLWKIERTQRNIFNPWNAQLLRIRKGQWKDNAYVERTHRTDDEELYVPYLTEMNNQQQHFKKTWAYVWDFNTARPHEGYNMQGKTPCQAVKKLGLDLPMSFYALPPLRLESLSKDFWERGHDLLATYFFAPPDKIEV